MATVEEAECPGRNVLETGFVPRLESDPAGEVVCWSSEMQCHFLGFPGHSRSAIRGQASPCWRVGTWRVTELGAHLQATRCGGYAQHLHGIMLQRRLPAASRQRGAGARVLEACLSYYNPRPRTQDICGEVVSRGNLQFPASANSAAPPP